MLGSINTPSSPYFSGKVKLISSSQLLGFMEKLPKDCIAGHPWTVSNGVKQAEHAATSKAADCLIIGGQTPLIKNLYHIEPQGIDPKKTAIKIGEELDDLSQKTGKGIDVLITGGDFGMPHRHNSFLHQSPKKPSTKPRWEIGRELFDELGNVISQSSFTNKLSILAGRTIGNSGHTGLAMKKGDTDWYLNVIRGNNNRITQGIQSPEAVKRMFDKISL